MVLTYCSGEVLLGINTLKECKSSIHATPLLSKDHITVLPQRKESG